VALTVKKVGSQEVAIFGQTATNFRKIVRAQRFHVPFFPQNVSKMEENRKKPQNEPKLRESCAPWQKNARLHKNPKVAQKLCSATSQFSGGTRQIQQYTSATDVIIFVQCHLSYAVAEW